MYSQQVRAAKHTLLAKILCTLKIHIYAEKKVCKKHNSTEDKVFV